MVLVRQDLPRLTLQLAAKPLLIPTTHVLLIAHIVALVGFVQLRQLVAQLHLLILLAQSVVHFLVAIIWVSHVMTAHVHSLLLNVQPSVLVVFVNSVVVTVLAVIYHAIQTSRLAVLV
jgi:hypothetical protein